MSNQGAPTVSPSQVTAAGIASAGAAAVTSFAGVAGTLIGAALTAMIITGGSAILRAYLENVGGKVRGVSGRVRGRTARSRAASPAGSYTVYGRPDLRNNSVGRLRAAGGWFSRLSQPNRRSILFRGLAMGAVAFVIGMVIVTVIEWGVLGNTFSCGLWSQCSAGATPRIGGGVMEAVPGATPGIGGGNAATSTFGRILDTGGGSSGGGLPGGGLPGGGFPGGGFPGGGSPDGPPAVQQQY